MSCAQATKLKGWTRSRQLRNNDPNEPNKKKRQKRRNIRNVRTGTYECKYTERKAKEKNENFESCSANSRKLAAVVVVVVVERNEKKTPKNTYKYENNV